MEIHSRGLVHLGCGSVKRKSQTKGREGRHQKEDLFCKLKVSWQWSILKKQRLL